jgi:hypothetical protein
VWVETQLPALADGLPPAVEEWLFIKQVPLIGMAQNGPIALTSQGTLNEPESCFDIFKDSRFFRRTDCIANIRENAGGLERREAMPITIDEE